MNKFAFLVGVLIATAGGAKEASASGAAATQDAAELIAMSQRLLDAVTAGDRAGFEETLSPNGLFVDEEGVVRDRAALIGQIAPLPPGYVGSLKMSDPQVRFVGPVGVVTYGVEETLHLYGQELDTHFHTTDTYLRKDGRWRLVAQQTSVYPSELTPVSIDPDSLGDYVGAYALDAETVLVVAREADHLYTERRGRAREALRPIGDDRFVRAGHPRGERFFRRDAAGRVVALVDRRDNNDLVWKRADTALQPN